MENRFDISTFEETLTIQKALVTLIENEKKCRKAKHISQKELAKMTGVSYASIRRFENNGKIFFTSLLKIADVLDCLEDFTSIFSQKIPTSLKDYKG